jgi:hypothetical protein
MLCQSLKLKESELKRRDLFQAPLSLSLVENKKSSEEPWNSCCCYPDSNRVLSSNSCLHLEVPVSLIASMPISCIDPYCFQVIFRHVTMQLEDRKLCIDIERQISGLIKGTAKCLQLADQQLVTDRTLNLTVHYQVHNSPPFASIPRHISAAHKHTHTSHSDPIFVRSISIRNCLPSVTFMPALFLTSSGYQRLFPRGYNSWLVKLASFVYLLPRVQM